MGRAARILILGRELPFREELLEHREIDTHWARSTSEVAHALRKAQVDACIVAPDFRDREAIWLIHRSLQSAPCLVLVEDPKERNAWAPDEATAVIPVAEIDSIVMLLAQYTGLRLARYPRADIKVPVLVDLHGRVYERTTRDLSLSGVAIADFPKAPVGVRAELLIRLEAQTVRLRGRLIRWIDEEEGRAAGLSFIDMPEGARAVVQEAVQKSLSKLPLQWEMDGLFGDLDLEASSGGQALRTQDLASSPVPAFVPRTADMEIPIVQGLVEGTLPADAAPQWLVSLVSDLTGVEGAAARGRPAPPWALAVLKLRINLARVRDKFPDRPPPSALIDDAYRMFERLRRETEGETGAILSQVRRIRTDLLRQMVRVPRTDDIVRKSA